MRLYWLVVAVETIGTTLLFAKIEHWNDFGDMKVSEHTGTKDTMPALVIVRPATLEGSAVNVYVDGEYLTSLLPGAYTIERICPGKHRISLAYTDVQRRYREKRVGGKFFVFKPDRTYYIGIEREGTQLNSRVLSLQEAKQVSRDYTRKQTHTISRISKRKCK
jgi:hypothetical protein